jgi:hypothetical protein
MKKIKFYNNEIWKEFYTQHRMKKRYTISNYGRLISFTDEIENGALLKGSYSSGYLTFSYKKIIKGKEKNFHLMRHKLVAGLFCAKKSDEHKYVIHLNFTHDNNHFKNLKWVTREEMLAHNRKSPLVIKAQKQFLERNKTRKGHKLTDAMVVLIKKKINNPNRKTRMKMIAKQFNISEMQLYRIKSGENWSRIKV